MRKFVQCTLALMMCLPLTACHTGKQMQSFAVPESFDTTKKQEITFWAKNDTNKSQVAVYQNAISEFESYYPNVHVNLRLYTDYGKIYNDVITNISTGTTPDVCITYPDHIATYMTGSNTVVPLDALLEDETYGLNGSDVAYPTIGEGGIVDKYLEEGKLSDETYAIPFMRSTEALYMNKTFVERLGYEVPEVVTWDFIWEVSEAATQKVAEGNYAVNGQKVLIPFIYKSTDNMMIQYLQQAEAPYSNDAGKIEIFHDQTADFLKTIASHVSTGAFSTFKLSGYPANFLDAGQCIFAIDSTAGSTWMGADAPLSDIDEKNRIDFETAVRPVPQLDTENIQMISQGPSICLFNKDDPQRVLASWLFAQYLLSDSVQIPYAETEGYVPVTNTAQNSEDYQSYLAAIGTDNNDHYPIKIEATNLLLNHIDDTFVTSVFNGSASLRNAAGGLIESTVKSAKRNEAIDEAYIESLYANITSLYRLDQIEQNNAKNGSIDQDLGPLPIASKWLLGILVVTWIGIVSYYMISKKRNRENTVK